MYIDKFVHCIYLQTSLTIFTLEAMMTSFGLHYSYVVNGTDYTARERVKLGLK